MLAASLATTNQAQAAAEAGRAAHAASRGSAAAPVAVLLLVTLLAAAAVGVYRWIQKRRQAENEPPRALAQQSQWQPGPNAYWGKREEPKPVDPVQALTVLLLQQMIDQKKAAQSEPPARPENSWKW